MGIFDFFKKKTDIEEYCEKREKDKKREEKNIGTGKKVEMNNEKYLDAIAVLLHSDISKIDKIKKVRELTGLELEEAVKLVDGVRTYENINVTNNTALLDDILNSDMDKIQKIKRVRELTGLGLKESVEVVDGVRTANVTYENINVTNNTASLDDILNSNMDKIQKIKRVQKLTGLGLKESKDLVERK